jgi:hypothetical protein
MSETNLNCILTLALPGDLEEEVLDQLARYPHWLSGYSVTHAEGHGSGAQLRSTMEKVRGRSSRRLVQIVMDHAHVAPLIAALRESFQTPEIAWWTVPVNAFGRFS